MFKNTTGHNNTASGTFALYANTTGDSNVGIGNEALSYSTTGSSNIGIGYFAGSALTTGSDNIDIGNVGVVAESSTIRIGTAGTHSATYVAGIYGATATSGVAVYIDSNGQLGTATSSRQFKDDIAPMAKSNEAILSLKPVTFHYKTEIDAHKTPQFGLIAEEVAQVDPDLVARDAKGDIYTVRYEAVNAMMLNEFLKQHKRVTEQEKTIGQQQKQIEAMNERMTQMSRLIEKVSQRVE